MDAGQLVGGVNVVRRVGQTVVRPAGLHSPTVHRLLRHLRSRGFDLGPEPLGIDQGAGTETLSFVPGDVTDYPVSEPFRTDEVLVEAASMLRSYHDATVDFVTNADDRWYLPEQEPAEVICHGDFGPHNCAVVGGRLSGVFDFDTAHPGPRLQDVGYAAYRWVPLTGPAGSESWNDLEEQGRRLRLFCSAYGGLDQRDVLEAAVVRLQMLVEFMRQRAANGHAAFARHAANGHDLLYLADAEHIGMNRAQLVGG